MSQDITSYIGTGLQLAAIPIVAVFAVWFIRNALNPAVTTAEAQTVKWKEYADDIERRLEERLERAEARAERAEKRADLAVQRAVACEQRERAKDEILREHGIPIPEPL